MGQRTVTAVCVFVLCGAAASAGESPFGVERIALPAGYRPINDLPSQVVDSADVDGDGIVDYLIGVASVLGAPIVGIAFGEPDGSFSFSDPMDLSSGVSAAAPSVFADTDGDGRPEIVVIGFDTWAVVPFEGRLAGDPHVRPLGSPAFTNSDPVRTVVADFAGDGADAIAYIGLPWEVSLLWPDGTSSAIDLDFSSPFLLPAEDYTGDGLIDIAVANESAQLIMVLPGTGSKQFGEPVTVNVPNTEGAIVDLNGDGAPDYACRVSGSVVWHPSIGSVPAPASQTIPAAGLRIVQVMEGVRFSGSDQDGLVVRVSRNGLSGGGDLAWWPRPMSGDRELFTLGAAGLQSGGPGVYEARDLTGDGVEDLVVAGTVIDVFDGRGCSAPVELGSGREESPDVMNFADVVDLNGDGMDEIIALGSGVVWIREGGDGPDRATQEIAVPGIGWMSAVCDRGGDRVIVGSSANGHVWVLEESGGAWSLGQTLGFPDPAAPRGLVVADLDQDGVEEIAVTDSVGSVRVLRFDEAGVLGEVASIPTLSSIALAAADSDGDGFPELFTESSFGQNIQVLRNLGGLAFAGDSPIVIGQWPYWIAAEDLDGDGLADLVTGRDEIVVLWGEAGGQFSQPEVLESGTGVGLNMTELVVADLDGDGSKDVAFASHSLTYPHQSGALLQAGPRVFGDAYPLVGESHPGVRAGDVNGDGAMDLVTAGEVTDIHWGRGAPCPADLTADCSVNVFDVQAFIVLYNAQDPGADLAAPFGVFNVFDVMAYIDAYNAGCP